MFLIRDASASDLAGVQRLAKVLNTVNLPDDAGALEALIDVSVRSFSGRIKAPMEREYLFVMEQDGTIVGTSQIIAQHGTRDAPHIYLDVLHEERYSETVDRHFKHTLLRIGFDYDGPTEIGGLVLDPSHRRTPGKLGKQLSFVRFLFIAMHRPQFRDRIIAELLPPLGEGGRSALWEAFGRRFTQMDYLEADRISKTNKEFIKNLFPSGVVYASLFDKDAQDVIGRVGPQTEGVRKMLMDVGFQHAGRVDPFDGGPHFHARVEDVWPIMKARVGSASVVDRAAIVDSAGESADGLVAFEPKAMKAKALGHFRCAATELRFGPGDRIEIPTESARALGVDSGDKIWALPFAVHTRL